MSGVPSISVIIPAIGNPDYLRRALESLADQSRPADEVIVVIDQTDHRPFLDVTRSMLARLPQLVVLANAENLGIERSTIRAAQESWVEWIALLDHDDELLPHALEGVANVLREASDQTDAVFTNRYYHFTNGLGKGRDVFRDFTFFENLYFSPYDAIVDVNYLSHLKVYRRTLIPGGALFRADGAQDWLWNFGFVATGRSVAVREPLYRHFIHAHQFSQQAQPSWVRDLSLERRRRVQGDRVPGTSPTWPISALTSVLEDNRFGDIPALACLTTDSCRVVALNDVTFAESVRDSANLALVMVVSDANHLPRSGLARVAGTHFRPSLAIAPQGATEVAMSMLRDCAPYMDAAISCDERVLQFAEWVGVPESVAIASRHGDTELADAGDVTLGALSRAMAGVRRVVSAPGTRRRRLLSTVLADRR